MKAFLHWAIPEKRKKGGGGGGGGRGYGIPRGIEEIAKGISRG